MKINENTLLFLDLGVLVGFLIYKNVKGIPDKEPNYSRPPKF